MSVGKIAAIGMLLALAAPCLAGVTTTGSTIVNPMNTYVGAAGDGTLAIDTPGMVNDASGYVGYGLGCTGTATVTGASSRWINSNRFYVGYGGTGVLDIEAGGQVSNTIGYVGYSAGSLGTVTVNGTSSTWTNTGDLYVGYDGSGRLTVSNGGSITAKTLYANLSDLSGNGTMAVKGAVLDGELSFDSQHGLTQTLGFGAGGGLTLTLDPGATLGAGFKGTGTLRVAEGMTVASALGYLGLGAGSSGTAVVTGTNSRWTDSGTMHVGEQGSGRLIIEAGGQVSNSIGYMGYSDTSTGTVTVTGTGSKWIQSGSLYAGYFGSGNLEISAGGQVENATGFLGFYTISRGTASVSGIGSSWTCSEKLYVGCFGSGSLTVTDGGSVTAGTLFASAADLHGNGSITAHGVVLDDEVIFDSDHGPVHSMPFGTGGSLNLVADGSGALGAGCKAAGSLRIADGLTISSLFGYLGFSPGSTGKVTVTGGATWTSSNDIFVGNYGAGELTIDAGGHVNDTFGRIAYYSTSTGMITVAGAGSTWTNSLSFFIGQSGTGILRVASGGCVTGPGAFMAYLPSATGAAIVTGAGSTLDARSLYVGYAGRASLAVSDGALVKSSTGYLSHEAGSFGTATVTGAGSTWANDATLYVGYAGTGANGELTISDGGKVTAKSLIIYGAQSSVSLHVSGDAMLVLGDTGTAGALISFGTVNYYADAFLAHGVYSPITEYAGRAINWTGSGSIYNACGGTWSSTSHTLAVTAPTMLPAGATDAINSGERMLFTDAAGGRAGASFGTVAAGLNFSATPMSAADLEMLLAGPGFVGSVLAGWDFSTNLTSSQVMLSFDVGPDFQDVQVWHFAGGTWSQFTPDMLTYDSNGIVSFTVDSFSGYAVTGQVPEPASISAVCMLAGLLLRRRRRQSR